MWCGVRVVHCCRVVLLSLSRGWTVVTWGVPLFVPGGWVRHYWASDKYHYPTSRNPLLPELAKVGTGWGNPSTALLVWYCPDSVTVVCMWLRGVATVTECRNGCIVAVVFWFDVVS